MWKAMDWLFSDETAATLFVLAGAALLTFAQHLYRHLYRR
jgi:hypothetical protein